MEENTVVLLKTPSEPYDQYEIEFKKNEFNPKFIPLLCHTSYNIPGLIADLNLLLNSKSDKKILIVTSQRAIEALSEAIYGDNNNNTNNDNNKTLINLQVLLSSVQIYVVGKATGISARELGFKTVLGEESGTGSKLADIIINDIINENNNKKINNTTLIKNVNILFCTGEKRKDELPLKLSDKKIQNDISVCIDFKERIVYKTEEKLDSISIFKDILIQNKDKKKNLWICFFSPAGTRLIIDYLQTLPYDSDKNTIHNNGNNIYIASIGPTTTAVLKKKNIHVNVTASQPDFINLIHPICKYKYI